MEPRIRRVVVHRRGGGDEELVVQVGAAERALEEVVEDRVVGRAMRVQVLVDRQRLRVVVAHHETAGVGARFVAILLAAVELVLLLVEAVHDVARTAAREPCTLEDTVRREDARRRARRVGRRDVVVDGEGRIGECARERRAGGVRALAHRCERRRRQVDVELQQTAVRESVLVVLERLDRRRVLQAVHTFPAAVQVVEAVVLLVDDDEVLDLRELLPDRRSVVVPSRQRTRRKGHGAEYAHRKRRKAPVFPRHPPSLRLSTVARYTEHDAACTGGAAKEAVTTLSPLRNRSV